MSADRYDEGMRRTWAWVASSLVIWLGFAAPAMAVASHKLVNVVVPVGEAPSAIDGIGTTVYVANTLSNSISVVDAVRGRVVRTVVVPASPTALAIDGSVIWVALTNGTVVRYSRTSWRRLGTTAGFTTPTGVVVGAQRVWVVDSATNTVTILRRSTGARIGSFSTYGEGAVAPLLLAGHLLVANATSGEVQAFDPASGALQETFLIGGHPSAMTVAGGEVWVASSTLHTLAVIDVAADKTVAHYPTAGLHTGAITTVGNHVLVASAGTNLVIELEVATGKIYRGHRVGRGPGAMVYVAGRLWVCDVANRSIDGITL